MDNKINKMLIDATHPEETRVVVLRNGRVEEFDYESAARKLLRGNIYLAKVTRVEPSLQAAFVEYGGNRHGFLAFNEIHPDYYQIPVSDRQALIDEEAAAEAEADAEADARAERKFQGGGSGRRRESGRDGGRENGGRNGGRNGPRQHTHAAPAGSGDQPQDPARELEAEAEIPAPHDHGDQGQPDTSSHDAGAHDASGHHHDHGDDHAHEQTGAPEGSPVTQPDTTGHHAERVTEAYAAEGSSDDDRHVHSDAGHHDHAGHDAASHDDDGHDHSEHRHSHDEAHGHGVQAEAAHDGRGGTDHIEEVPEVTEAPETIGAGADLGTEDDVGEDAQERPRRQRRRQYKIQEVIKRRQVILVQVVKEERGNKGAALTTYLSLAGRYTVLMPNTGRGGGISRKITNPADRKRLKAIAQELDVPEGMGLIIRTAGAARTSQEIKRDYEYLLRLWESVRDMTLQSTAPSLVYEEGNLIKRSIRDLYSKEIDEVVVAGDQAYTDAHDFMRMLMPSHAKNVIKYNHPEALFTRYPIERQLNAMFSPYVTLRSGGYLVINQTEALVSIDVNSGKSTREYSIEETALATNLEASDEIARQLKLRDLAGLIVIDFIDMEEKRNNRSVERRLTDALRFDRARIQVGRISHFGLMEMSRQRMRTGVLEGSTSQCPHCQGTGMIRSTESVALAVLRGLEDHLVKDPRSSVNVMTTAIVALYILNNKRSFITDIERRYGISVTVQASDRMQGANFAIERNAAAVVAPRQADRAAVSMDWGFEGEEPHEHNGQHGHDSHRHDTHHHENTVETIENDADTGGDEGGEAEARGESGDGNRTGRRRRRRRGRDRGGKTETNASGHDDAQRGPRDENQSPDNAAAQTDFSHRQGGQSADVVYDDAAVSDTADTGDDSGVNAASANGVPGEDGERSPRRGRRRGRRGGRRGRENRDETVAEGMTGDGPAEGMTGDGPAEASASEQSRDANDGDVATAVADAAAGRGDHVGDAAHPTPEHAHGGEDMDSATAQSAVALASEPETPPRQPRQRAPRREPSPERQVEPATAHEEVVQAPVAHEQVATAAVSAPAESHADVQPVTPHQAPAVAQTAGVTDVPAPKTEPVPVAQLPEAPEDPTRPRRRGWWQRRGLGE